MKPIAQIRPSAGTVLIRSLVVGAAYAVLSALAAAILGRWSSQPPTWQNALVWWLTGTLVGLLLSPFLLSSTWSERDSMLAVWALLVLVRSLGLGIEGSLFRPAPPPVVIAGVVSGILIALLVAWLAVLLLMPSKSELQPVATVHRSWWGWTWRVLLVGLAYFIFYSVFGATNALLYTRSFYENNPQYGLALPPFGTIFLAQSIRGLLFGLGSLFLVRSSSMSRRRTAVWLGLLLYVVGGLGPYVENVYRNMPLGFNLATLAELFLQNFSTGLVAASLYKPKISPAQPKQPL